jgi:hypothetical protein
LNKIFFGICNGKPFKRCPAWRMSEEHVECAGMIYEKVSPDFYVLPDMDQRSTVLRLIRSLGYEYRYEIAGHMHQAEFMNLKENCYCATSIEPWIPDSIQKQQQQWAEYLIKAWKTEGGRPIQTVDHHKWGDRSWVTDSATGCVRKMGIDFTTLLFNCPSLVIETQMGFSRTPLEEQMRLGSVAIKISLDFLLEKLRKVRR